MLLSKTVKKINLIILLLVIPISFVALHKVFNLALFGDDYLAIWRFNYYLAPQNHSGWNILSYFVTPYGAQDITFGILHQFFNLQSFYYQCISFILRLMAAFSLLPLTYYLTKNKFASFFAVLFFSVTAIGLDTTNWTFNLTSYVSLTFFNLFLFFLLKFNDDGRKLQLLLSLVFFYLASIWAPIRMTGLLPLLIILEAYFFIKNKKTNPAKKTILTIVPYIVVFIFISLTGSLPNLQVGLSNTVLAIATDGLNSMVKLLSQGRFDFLFYPFLVIGTLLVPDHILAVGSFTSTSQLFRQLLVPIFLFFGILIYILKVNLKYFSKRLFLTFLVSGVILSLMSLLVYYFNKSFVQSKDILFILLGLLFISFNIFLFLAFRKNRLVSQAIFVSLTWILLSFIFIWIRAPDTKFPTVHRYLISPATGFSIWLAVLITLGKNFRSQLIISLLVSILIFIHIYATNIYLDQQLTYHNEKSSIKVWSVIPNLDQVVKNPRPLVFYLENDGSNGAILHTMLGFGFDERIAATYQIYDLKKIPIIYEDWDALVSAVTDGKSIIPYAGRIPKPIPIENIYAYRLIGQDTLINITSQTRDKLKQILK